MNSSVWAFPTTAPKLGKSLFSLTMSPPSTSLFLCLNLHPTSLLKILHLGQHVLSIASCWIHLDLNELLCSSQNSSMPSVIFCCVRHPPAREAVVPGTFACSAVCFVMPPRLNLECIPCKRWLIARGCTCKFALEFWVLIIRCLRSSIHLRCAGCSNVSDHCWALNGGESLPFLTVIVIPPLSMILAGDLSSLHLLELPPVRTLTAHRH